MHSKTHNRGNSGKYRNGLLAFCLLMVFFWPQSAKAQFCPPGGCSSLLEQVFKDGKDLLWQAGDVIWKIGTSLQLAAGPVATAFTGLASAGYNADLANYNAQSNHRLAHSNDAAAVGGTLLNSSSTTCHNQQAVEGRGLASTTTPSIAGGLAYGSVNHSSTQGTGAAAYASQLAIEISHGFRDCGTSGAYGNLLQSVCNGATTTIGNESFLNADVLLSSLLGYDQYNVPAGTLVSFTNSSGSNAKLQDLMFPKIQNLSPAPLASPEEHFIAAYYYCQRWKPHMPPPPSGNNRQMTTNDPVVLEQQLDLVAKSDGPYEICLNALARRTAVSQTVAQKLGGQWNNMYQAQLQTCTQMHNMGIISQCLFDGTGCQSTSNTTGTIPASNCKNNGISQVALERANAYRFSQANYLVYLVANQQVTPEKLMSMQQTEEQIAIQNFESALTMEKIGVATALNGAMTLPTGPTSNPTSQGISQ